MTFFFLFSWVKKVLVDDKSTIKELTQLTSCLFLVTSNDFLLSINYQLLALNQRIAIHGQSSIVFWISSIGAFLGANASDFPPGATLKTSGRDITQRPHPQHSDWFTRGNFVISITNREKFLNIDREDINFYCLLFLAEKMIKKERNKVERRKDLTKQ